MKRIELRHKMICGFLDSCKEKLKQEPNNIDLIRTRGILYNLVEKYDKAIRDFEQIIDTMPKDVSSHFLKSDCLFKMGEFDLAKRIFLRGLQLDSDPDIPESAIENAVISNDQELKEMEEVLEFEKNKAILAYLPQLIE